jgi:hypothetical protein
MAHEDFTRTQTFDKIIVRVHTGFHYEEIKKVWMIGELSARLASDLNYQDSIILDFIHSYATNESPQCFVSFGDGSIESLRRGHWDGHSSLLLNSKAIHVIQISTVFDVAISLKLVEYSILNGSTIQNRQKPLQYSRGYFGKLIFTIDTAEVRQVTASALSINVDRVLKSKVYRQEDSDIMYRWFGISYYLQDGKFFVFSKELNDQMNYIDSILLRIDRISQFVRLGQFAIIVFDSDSTFYYASTNRSFKVSKHHTIKNIGRRQLDPFEVTSIGGENIAIYFWSSDPNNNQGVMRTLIYQYRRDVLTQDLDALLNTKPRQ